MIYSISINQKKPESKHSYIDIEATSGIGHGGLMARIILTITQPDDFHLHLRHGAMLASVLAASASVFGRATVMPNLLPPITSGAMAADYKKNIMALCHKQHINNPFQPLMTLYLTEQADPDQWAMAYQAGQFFAVKYYPKGATTNSDSGIGGDGQWQKIKPILAMMEQLGIPLLVHGEAVGKGKDGRTIDVFDRERVFIETSLTWLLEHFPALKISLEHITTAFAVRFLQQAGNHLGASITCHHLLLNRNDIFHHQGRGGLNPHHYCLPLLKREEDREALLDLVTSGFPRVFAGTDSAPHGQASKESACGCAGVFSAPVAIPAYYLAFARANRTEHFESFVSHHGARFFNLPTNSQTLSLVAEEWVVPASMAISNGAADMNNKSNHLVPFLAGETLPYRVMVNPSLHAANPAAQNQQ